jgi:hypothetical protein
MARLFLAGLLIVPALGCASADPLAGKGSTAHPALQKETTKVQADAAAGLVTVPQPATASLVCAYDTPKGHVNRAIADGETCPTEPPGGSR